MPSYIPYLYSVRVFDLVHPRPWCESRCNLGCLLSGEARVRWDHAQGGNPNCARDDRNFSGIFRSPFDSFDRMRCMECMYGSGTEGWERDIPNLRSRVLFRNLTQESRLCQRTLTVLSCPPVQSQPFPSFAAQSIPRTAP